MTVNGPIQTKNNHGNLQNKNCHWNEKNNKVKIPANQMKKERRKKLKKKTTWINLNEQATYASQVMWTEIRQ
jgi:rRNA maturation endonuclease Nob1